MTRNEQILLIMSWARSFHGLHLSDCVMLATRVLDKDFSGSIADADPAEVMSAMDKRYFEAQSQGEVMVPNEGHVPRWEDHGFVRPPIAAEPTVVILSDDTVVDMAYIDVEAVTLVSGGTIPVLSEDQRKVIFPTVFADPTNTTQTVINELIADTPVEFVPKTHGERVALEVYETAQKKVDEMRGAMMREHERQHQRDQAVREKLTHSDEFHDH